MSILFIIAVILAVAGIVSAFIPRMPAALVSFAGLLLLWFGDAPYVSGSIVAFWFAATAIVVGLRAIQPKALTLAPGTAYVAGGAALGTVLGYLIRPYASTIILGAAVGAFLGVVAFMRTPAGPRLSLGSRDFVEYLSAKGLPAVVTMAMSAIIFACAL